MNPLVPTNAIQIRYISPIFEPIYDEEDNQVDDECVRDGTDVLYECIVPTNKDKLPRYYRLRYRENAKDHKRRWERWLEENLIDGITPYFTKVKKIGRRVLFEYDSTLIEKREKKLRAIQHKKETQARKLARQVAPDMLVGETEQGEAVYEDRESGDRYEER
tara:strand:- start:625 stop:1110 length:486 start_codon:yes stop_codon:yes gene_type:complete